MSAKIIVCRCEDVTLSDIERTHALGYTHLEEVKRYTGLGTGPCQGRECMVHAAILCAHASKIPVDKVRPFTARPPLQPVSLAILAGEDE